MRLRCTITSNPFLLIYAPVKLYRNTIVMIIMAVNSQFHKHFCIVRTGWGVSVSIRFFIIAVISAAIRAPFNLNHCVCGHKGISTDFPNSPYVHIHKQCNRTALIWSSRQSGPLLRRLLKRFHVFMHSDWSRWNQINEKKNWRYS